MDSNSPNQVAGVSIDTEGNVLKCAKGLGTADCGYSAGAPVCGKCGALPIEMKVLRADEYEMLQKALNEKTFIASTLAYSVEEQHSLHNYLQRSLDTNATTNAVSIRVDSIYQLMSYQFSINKMSGYFSVNHKQR